MPCELAGTIRFEGLTSGRISRPHPHTPRWTETLSVMPRSPLSARQAPSGREGMGFCEARDFLFCGVCGTLLSFDSLDFAKCPLCGFKRAAEGLKKSTAEWKSGERS
ncbi:hypothetical protein COCNU_scaffold003371G000060 [Cocos nucifera]|nr:hypothetical protein [Cocos nucifera]